MKFLRSSKIGTWLGFALFAVVTLLPFYWILLSAITPRQDLFSSPVHYWPEHPTLDNFIYVLTEVPFWRYLLNTFFVSAVVTVIALFFHTMAGYALALTR